MTTRHILAPCREALAAESCVALGGVDARVEGLSNSRAQFGITLMWWNFVARTREEIAQARADWERQRFGEVQDYQGPRLSAPSLLRFARPNPVS
jgi:hypothetical protein